MSLTATLNTNFRIFKFYRRIGADIDVGGYKSKRLLGNVPAPTAGKRLRETLLRALRACPCDLSMT
ncbi:MAG: hypothetical protein QW569_05325 [Candidatus Bathyarchaeia archaeon]|nr:hypothetical protein [Candidatus Bathyarchaeota archaeon]